MKAAIISNEEAKPSGIPEVSADNADAWEELLKAIDDTCAGA